MAEVAKNFFEIYFIGSGQNSRRLQDWQWLPYITAQ